MTNVNATVIAGAMCKFGIRQASYLDMVQEAAKDCLDDLPGLGSFVEIEGPDDKSITDAQRNLGLADLPHILESYALLVEQKLKERARA